MLAVSRVAWGSVAAEQRAAKSRQPQAAPSATRSAAGSQRRMGSLMTLGNVSAQTCADCESTEKSAERLHLRHASAVRSPAIARLHGQVRWTAPCRSAARATAASRAAVVSSSVRVRSGARKRSAKASDFRPSPTCGPGVDVEQPHRLEQLAGTLAQGLGDCRRPAPRSSTTSATSSLATGNDESVGPDAPARRAASARRGRPRRRPTRSGRPNAWQTFGCSSPA